MSYGLCLRTWAAVASEPTMLNKDTRDTNAFPPSQVTVNAYISNANQSNEARSVFLSEHSYESMSVSTPYQMRGNIKTQQP